MYNPIKPRLHQFTVVANDEEHQVDNDQIKNWPVTELDQAQEWPRELRSACKGISLLAVELEDSQGFVGLYSLSDLRLDLGGGKICNIVADAWVKE